MQTRERVMPSGMGTGHCPPLISVSTVCGCSIHACETAKKPTFLRSSMLAVESCSIPGHAHHIGTTRLLHRSQTRRGPMFFSTTKSSLVAFLRARSSLSAQALMFFSAAPAAMCHRGRSSAYRRPKSTIGAA